MLHPLVDADTSSRKDRVQQEGTIRSLFFLPFFDFSDFVFFFSFVPFCFIEFLIFWILLILPSFLIF